MESVNSLPSEAMLLEVDHVSKQYRGRVEANDNISLTVKMGEVFGLLGPNDAGKTTLVNQIIGLAMPTSSTIKIAGVILHSGKHQKRVYLPRASPIAVEYLLHIFVTARVLPSVSLNQAPLTPVIVAIPCSSVFSPGISYCSNTTPFSPSV